MPVSPASAAANMRAIPMPRFRLTIEYAGTRYSGWQVQKNARTVAGEVLAAAANWAAVAETVRQAGHARHQFIAGVHLNQNFA